MTYLWKVSMLSHRVAILRNQDPYNEINDIHNSIQKPINKLQTKKYRNQIHKKDTTDISNTTISASKFVLFT